MGMNYIHKIRNIIMHFDSAIKERFPLNLIRFGDGGVKFIHSFIFNDIDQLNSICKREGMPLNKVSKIIHMWSDAATYADYIDSPEIYFDGRFWPRMRTPKKDITKKTRERMLMWDDLYGRLEFENYNYCNPESNYLSVLRVDNWVNILDVMKNRKICIITAKTKIKAVLSSYGYDVDVIEIVGHNENQYENSYDKVMKYIEQKVNQYDLFLIAAGELGRIYSGRIKELGGRCFDIGFIIEFWLGQRIHTRLWPFMIRSCDNPLELKLTKKGQTYEKFI